MSTQTLDLAAAVPIKGRLTRRAALQGTAAAAIALAAGNGAAEAGTPPMRSDNPVLLDLASRVEKLAALCLATTEERATLEDRVSELCPAPASLPQPPLRNPVQSIRTETALITTVTQPFERDPAWVEWERQAEAAKRAHEDAERTAAEKVGLPKVRRLAERQEARLDRLSAQLASMPAVTSSEVAAKSRAASALVGTDVLARDADLTRHADLVLSALRDASRLGAAPAGLVDAPVGALAVKPDAALLDLIRRHGEAAAAAEEATLAADHRRIAALEAYPPAPEALLRRPDDFPRTSFGRALAERDTDGGPERYSFRAAKWLRQREPFPAWSARVRAAMTAEEVAACEARRLEIIAAWDADQAARSAIDNRVGYTAAVEVEDKAAGLVVELAAEIKSTRPQTMDGLRTLAQWVERQAEAGEAHDDLPQLFAATVAAFAEVEA